MKEKLKRLLSGIYVFEYFDKNGELIDVSEFPNNVTDEGIDYLLDAGLAGGTQVTAWYVAILDVNHTPAETDTYANSMGIANYESTDYSESTRPSWTPGSVASQQVDSYASRATFTMLGNDTTIYGSAVVSNSTKGDSAGGGILLSIGLEASPKTGIENGTVLKVGYRITGDQI